MSIICRAFVLASLLFFVTSFQLSNRISTSLIKHVKLAAWGGGGQYGGRPSYGRGGGGRGGGGGGRYGRGPPRPRQNPYEKLRFKETIKIDPEIKTPVADINLSATTRRVLEEKGFTHLTPVQSQSFDKVFEGGDVVARSRTGTGKTFAFGLPLIEKVVSMGLNTRRSARDGLPLILVLEPTRELALQVAQELGSVCAAHKMRVQAIFGGVSFTMQERAIRAGVHILVATPGRALDHISRGTVDLSNVAHVVLDEGDTMLEMGFQKDVESILMNVKSPGEEARRLAAESLRDHGDDEEEDEEWKMDDSSLPFDDDEDSASDAPPSRAIDPVKSAARKVQMLLFSATMPGWICTLTEKLMKEPIFLDAVQEGETRLAKTITHYAMQLPPSGDRIEGISSCIEDLILTKGAGGQTIIFTNTKEEADNLMTANCFGQLKSQVLHGDIGQGSRQVTIRQFKERQLDVLVATDVAARGLDIAGVDLVINTAAPNDFDTYVHRSGRTGRAGRSGSSVLLIGPGDERKIRNLESELNFKFQRIGAPGPAEIAEASAVIASKKLEKVDNAVTKQFVPHAKRLLHQYMKTNRISLIDDEEDIIDDEDFDETDDESDIPNTDTDTDMALKEDEEPEQDVIEDVENYSAAEVEELMARCLAAISNRNSISCRYGCTDGLE
jgi:ATP-dependent RNA helicase DDX21